MRLSQSGIETRNFYSVAIFLRKTKNEEELGSKYVPYQALKIIQ